MPRKSRSTGVGRGNGLGSAKTQFKDGMPSANPLGRPKAPKETPPASMLEALALELAKPIPIKEHGKRRNVPQFQMLAMNMMLQLPDASMAQQIAAMKMFVDLVPNIANSNDDSIPKQTIEDIIAIMAEEVAAEEARDRELAARLGRFN